ncbi:Gfo/Idh/MocA family protein [Deinococcus peraridilitoris]|uniref:Putative dehydrogenase n=1 Tax=Deinococcus peraridilitoris (strain DSM 19664 / LMG 22246 / CIP 109416 / KR-200) TaxID=937777 RepID=L0A2W4_DEIPD|nr:Gfo/Idh/MocA family oxidoreductase [Deinococcus peraridilitoris]AFZ67527.1 putative dehydrogenase [Deinococcus peraridilitoris DSM 19664]
MTGGRVGFAILGPGKVAHTHAAALSQLPHTHLRAVCGRDAARTAAFAQAYGARPYTDLEELLGQSDVQAIILCTPHPQHALQAELAARAGKHVLVEKPMALSVTDADRMIRAARESGVKLGVVSQRRLYESVQRVRQAIVRAALQRPVLATLNLLGWRGPEYYAMDAWRGSWAGEGGGVLVNQAVHQLDLLQWLMGEVQELSADWANLNHPEIEVEDTAVATLRFRSGALGSIVVSNSQRPGLWGRLHIHGSNGASVGVQTDGGSSFVAGVTQQVEPPLNDLWTVPGEEALLAGWQAADRQRAQDLDVMTHYHALQVSDFASAVLEDRPPLVPGEEGRKTVELIEAIYRAGRTRSWVRFLLSD